MIPSWLKDIFSAPNVRGAAKHPGNERAINRKHAATVANNQTTGKNIPVSGAANAAYTSEANTARNWERQHANYKANR
jgi:hypothetical protein